MLTDSVLVAIDAALGGDHRCRCGRDLIPVERDGALWLVCDSNRGSSRLPAALVAFTRTYLHDNTFIVELPSTTEAPTELVRPLGTVRPVAAAA